MHKLETRCASLPPRWWSRWWWAGVLVVCIPAAAAAQVPDSTRRDSTTRRTPRDSAQADSARIADSIAVVRELERAQGNPRTQTPAQPGQAPRNPRLLPDISVVGDLIGDLSPDGSTQEGGERFGVREIELALQAAVDPYFRGDVFLGFSDLEGVHIEQAYLTAGALPWGLELRLGRFLMPVGKQNTTHGHDLHTIEYPYALQRFFGAEGLKGTGLYASRVFAPLGFYQELILTAVDRFGEASEDITTLEPVNKKLSGLGYSARVRNYWDLNEASNIELSFSGVTGKREQPVEGITDGFGTPARQSVVGADFTYRWRPLQQGLYRSFILQAEFMRQLNERDPRVLLPGGANIPGVEYAGPDRDFSGSYVFARYQLTRRTHVGARFDALQDEAADGRTSTAASGYLQWYPSEYSKLVAAYERYSPAEGSATNRILLQATFALGPHRPHPF
ncbi:MAG TPA: hypothetical protein VFZ21_09810 [Gemmatimonadaceae bacterium]|nr:hypothetical protein [Gemmatimonadaceae bacterium]